MGNDEEGAEAAVFAETLSARLAGYGDRPCIEFERKWYSGNDITGYINEIADGLSRAGVNPDEPVGLVVRNRVPHAAMESMCGVLATRLP